MDIRRLPFWLSVSIINSIFSVATLETCMEFTSDSPSDCLSCSEGFFSLRESAFKTNPFPASECLIKNSSVLELDFFVSDRDCINSSPCNGSLDHPFDNLVFALDLIHNLTIMYDQAKINLYLLGEQIFVLQKDLQASRKYYFRRSFISLTISPFPCSIQKVYGCKGESELFNIYLKTNLMLLFVSGTLHIRNLVINGVDMPLEMVMQSSLASSSASSCYQEKKICCTKDNYAGQLSGDDFTIYCKMFLNQTMIPVTKIFLHGLFTSEILPHDRNPPLPEILVENCSFEEISTSFATDIPRFSSLFRILDSRVNLKLKDLIVNECAFADGLLKKEAGVSELLVDDIFKPSFMIVNVSISDIKTVLIEKRERNSVIFIDDFDGEISMSEICLKKTKDASLLLLDLSLLRSVFQVLDANFIDNEGVGFLSCKECNVLKVEGTVFRRSVINMVEGVSLFDVKDSEGFFLNRTVIEDISFLKGTSADDISRSLLIMNGIKNIEVSDFYSQRVTNLGISVKSLDLVLRRLVVLEVSNEFRFLSARNSSVMIEDILLMFIEMNFEFLVTMESDSKGSDYVLRVLDGHISNIMFFKDVEDNGIFEWPLYTLSDAALMKNVSVFNCFHKIILNYVSFFMAYEFARVELEDVEFSSHKAGYNTLLYLIDFIVARLNNIKFRNNEMVDIFLIEFNSLKDDSKIYITNLEVSSASFTSECFYFRSSLGVFENFTLKGISGIYPSFYEGYISFYYGLIIFSRLKSCLLSNWLFESSEVFDYTPSHIFDFWYVSNALLQNITFYISEHSLSLSSIPEAHVLCSSFTTSITIQNLNVKNFYCQSFILGNFQYEGGVISFLNSETFLKNSYSTAKVYLNNVSIENCKFCKNGAIGFVNIGSVSLINISVLRSDNINAGTIAIFHGAAISIENIITQDISALQYGGSFLLVGTASLIIKNAFIRGTRAQFGGAVYLKYVNNLTLINFSCEDCKASFDGGVLYSLYSNINLKGGLASAYLAPKDGGYAFVKRGKVHLTGGLHATSGFAEKGGFLLALEVEEMLLQDISVSNSSAKEKGIFLLLEDGFQLHVRNITLADLISDSGFGCMFLYAKSISISIIIQDIFCFQVFFLSSTLVHLENELDIKKQFNFTMKNVIISFCKGSVAYFKSANFNSEHVISLQNIIVSESNSQLLPNKNIYTNTVPKQVFVFESSYLLIKNFSLKSIKFSLQCFAFSNSVISVDFLLFQANYIPESDAKVLYAFYLSNTTAKVLKISFLGEPKSTTALLFSEYSTITLENFTIYKCHLFFTSCIELYKSRARLSSLAFIENIGHVSGVISARNCSLILDYCDFKSNSAVSREIRISINTIVNDVSIIGNLEASIIFRFCTFLETSPGTSIVAISSSLNISNCNFLASRSPSSTFLSADLSITFKAIWSASSDIEILSCNFSNFISENGGTLKIEHEPSIKQEAKLFSLQDSIILNSISDFGGAFSLIGLLKIYILKNQFANNRAFKYKNGEYGNFGVGIYLCTLYCGNSSYELLSNVFLNNLADNWMATVFSNTKIIITLSTSQILTTTANTEPFDSNQYFNNTDSTNFKGNISFLPLKLVLIMTGSETIVWQNKNIETPFQALNESLNNSLNEKAINETSTTKDLKNDTLSLRSGEVLNLRFVLTDQLGRNFIIDHFSRAEITDSSKNDHKNLKFFFMSNKESISDMAEFEFKNFLIKTDLNKSFELQLSIRMNLNYVYPAYRELIKVEPLPLHFFTKPCEVGDIILEADSTCLKCPPGKYSIIDPMKIYNTSLDANLRCLVCPSNAICTGGSVIIPQAGFWRFSNTSTRMIECLSKLSCLGFDDGQLAVDELIHGKCAEHSYGQLCYICERGYGRFSKKGVCKICETEVASYIKLTISIVVFIFYTMLQIKLTLQKVNTSSAGILLKLIVTHFQQLSLISFDDTGLELDFEAFDLLEQIFSYLFEDVLTVDCLLEKLGYNTHALKVITTYIYPVILSLVIPLCWLLFFKIMLSRSAISKVKIVQILQVTLLVLFSIFFPEVMSKCLSLLTCLEVDDSNSISFLLYSPNVICWSPEHISYLMYVASPGLFLWGLLVPATIAYFLIKNKSSIKYIIEERDGYSKSVKFDDEIKINFDSKNKGLHSDPNKAKYLKFLFKGYSSEYYYWEVIVFFKKFLLICIGCISDLAPSKIRGVFLLIINSFFILIQIRCQPLESPLLNKLEFFSLLTIFLTADIRILMFSNLLRKHYMLPSVFVIIMHVLFIFAWLYLFLNEVKTIFSKTMIKKKIISSKRTHKQSKKHEDISIEDENFCSPINDLNPKIDIFSRSVEKENYHPESKFIHLNLFEKEL